MRSGVIAKGGSSLTELALAMRESSLVEKWMKSYHRREGALIGLIVIMGARWLCTSEVRVRFSYGPPNLTYENILYKSQDELLSALFSLLAFNFYILWNQKKSLKDIIISSICFLLALFSKESSIAYLILFPALLWLIFNESISKSLIKSSSFFIAGILFLIIRSVALSDVVQGYETSPRENILYAAHGWNEVAGTKLSILFYYFIKSVFPYSLSWDYSFNQIPTVS